MARNIQIDVKQEPTNKITLPTKAIIKNQRTDGREDGGEIDGSRVHFLSTPVKYLADLRSRVNSQQYSSI